MQTPWMVTLLEWWIESRWTNGANWSECGLVFTLYAVKTVLAKIFSLKTALRRPTSKSADGHCPTPSNRLQASHQPSSILRSPTGANRICVWTGLFTFHFCSSFKIDSSRHTYKIKVNEQHFAVVFFCSTMESAPRSSLSLVDIKRRTRLKRLTGATIGLIDAASM